jgi:predicted transcriptional regulator of viral defense system
LHFVGVYIHYLTTFADDMPTIMEKPLKLRDWILDLPKRGRMSYSTEELFQHCSIQKKGAVKSALNRLVEKGKIQSVWHGYYIIVPVEYELKGVVPPILYIDQLMKHLNKAYYISLLSAAAFYGAAHQQPLSLMIVTNGKNLRDKQKRGTHINFIYKKRMPHSHIQLKTTKTGYVSVSSPELTAFDLVLYQKEIGGLNRVATVLEELADEMNLETLTPEFLTQFPASIIQRMGYLLEKILDQGSKASVLYEKSNQAGIPFRKTLLKSDKQAGNLSDYEYNEVWKISINEVIEIDT